MNTKPYTISIYVIFIIIIAILVYLYLNTEHYRAEHFHHIRGKPGFECKRSWYKYFNTNYQTGQTSQTGQTGQTGQTDQTGQTGQTGWKDMLPKFECVPESDGTYSSMKECRSQCYAGSMLEPSLIHS